MVAYYLHTRAFKAQTKPLNAAERGGSWGSLAVSQFGAPFWKCPLISLEAHPLCCWLRTEWNQLGMSGGSHFCETGFKLPQAGWAMLKSDETKLVPLCLASVAPLNNSELQAWGFLPSCPQQSDQCQDLWVSPVGINWLCVGPSVLLAFIPKVVLLDNSVCICFFFFFLPETNP